ncbi:hypothetical protein M404DRAFT_997732 [Pisolithus tinctorius Marx 270]|uniref:Uncharacterized protein n=1 Tax=Pisolithus tinctorius Marx 270 TaxID=870435 RepID=A0A0C3PHP0_PISTI|nr:hypothetical protein M404DRAFT_997732 [Pisolithus tinctorius Marx 270]
MATCVQRLGGIVDTTCSLWDGSRQSYQGTSQATSRPEMIVCAGIINGIMSY